VLDAGAGEEPTTLGLVRNDEFDIALEMNGKLNGAHIGSLRPIKSIQVSIYTIIAATYA
jgi:hypothetical protein